MPSHNTSKIYPRKIAKFENLLSFWKLLPASKKPKGKHGEFFKNNINTILLDISNDLRSGNYKFQELTFKAIPKGNGKSRIICIPSIKDRFVQRFILDQLTNPKDKLSVRNKISFGSLKGVEQSVHAAIKQAIKLRKKYPWVLKTDISSFFDKINRKELIDLLRKKIKRSSLLPLLEQVVNCEIRTKCRSDKDLHEKSGIIAGKGLRQGMPLSPFLANVFLMSFDRFLSLKKNSFKVIRYVDDIIVFCSSEDECKNKKERIEKELEKLQLSIPSLAEINGKTEIKSPIESVVFLGFEIYKAKNGEYSKKIPQRTFDQCIEELESYSNYRKALEENLTLSSVFRRLESQQEGYKSAFKDASNLNAFLSHFQRVKQKVKKQLICDTFGHDLFLSLDKDKKRFLGFDFI